MKVHVATPAYDGKVHAEFAQSMLLAGYVLAKAGIEVSATIQKNCAFIDASRSLIVRQFLETDATHLMFVDADLQFDPFAIASLVNAGLPFCAGLYCKRGKADVYQAVLPDNKIKQRDGWIEAHRIPAGFMCIERGVLEIMSERAEMCKLAGEEFPLVFRIKREDGRMIGEDFSFCDDYMGLYRDGLVSEPIWIWPDIDLVHDGIPCNFHEHLSK